MQGVVFVFPVSWYKWDSKQQVNNKGTNEIINACMIHYFLRVKAVSERDEGLNFICDEL